MSSTIISETNVVSDNVSEKVKRKGVGRPKLFTVEEARERRLTTQKRIREEHRKKIEEWKTSTSVEQQELAYLLSNNTYTGEILDNIKTLLSSIIKS